MIFGIGPELRVMMVLQLLFVGWFAGKKKCFRARSHQSGPYARVVVVQKNRKCLQCQNCQEEYVHVRIRANATGSYARLIRHVSLVYWSLLEQARQRSNIRNEFGAGDPMVHVRVRRMPMLVSCAGRSFPT